MDIRKYGITVAVMILTAIFIYSVADAIAPQVKDDCYSNTPKTMYGPDYERQKATNCTNAVMDQAAADACYAQGYSYEEVWGADGCRTGYNCNSCYKEQEDARQSRNAVFFYVSVLVGLLSIVVGFMLPLGTIHEWVGLGFIAGGVIGMFIGTVTYWSDLTRLARPFVIGLELAVVLYIVYKRMKSEPSVEKVNTNNGPSHTSKRKGRKNSISRK